MILYRLAKLEDIKKLTDLFYLIDKEFPIPLSEKTNIEVLIQKLLKFGNILVVMDDDKFVGVIEFYSNDEIYKMAYISVIGVIKDYQNKGIAKKLLHLAFDISKNEGMHKVVLYTHKTNQPAISMYKNLGFIETQDFNRPDDIKFLKDIR